MTQYVINIGAIPNDGTGDPLRTAFNETNLNFDQVFAAGPVLSNIQIANNKILTTNTNGNLILAPNGTGVVQSNVSIVPNLANLRNLGSSTNRWATVYTQYINISGALTTSDLIVNGNLTVQGNTIQIGNIVTDTKTIQLSNTASNASSANGSGITVGANDTIATFLFSSSSNAWTTNLGLNVTGNILPSANVTYNLGSNTAQWKDLWVSNSTIYMNSVPITLAAGNVLTVNGNAVLTNNSSTTVSTTGNVTANYFFGNGSQLTGLAATYSNSNVATFMASFGSNTISTSGNITGGNIFGNIQAADGNTSVMFNQEGFLGADAGFSYDYSGNTLYVETVSILGKNSHGDNALYVGVTGFTPLGSNVVAQLAGNADSYTQVNFQNISDSPQASGDYIITANNGTDSSNFIDLGIAGNTWNGTQLNSLGNAVSANDGYLYVNGGNLVVGTYLNSGNVINTWKFGTDGNLTLPGATAGETIATSGGYITVGNLLIGQGGALFNSNNDSWALYGNRSDPGTSIFIPSDAAAGNGTPLFLENQISNVEIRSGFGTWNFGNTSNLTLPMGGVVSEGASPTGLGNTIALTPAGGSDADQQLLIYPTGNVMEGNHLHLTTGNLYNTELYLGNDNLYVKLANTGNVVINSYDGIGNAGQWTFGTNESLTLPGGSRLRPLGANLDIFAGTGSYVNLITSDESSYMGVGGAGGYVVTTGGTWNFETTGNLTAPGNVSAVGNVVGGNLIATGNIVLTGSLVGSGASPAPSLSGFSSVSAITVSASGNISATGNVTGGNILGNGAAMTGVATKTTGTWTLVTGTNTVSLTVPLNGTYSIWVSGNIPNGIVVWNATVTVTNNNVPAIGQQFAWYYPAPGNALVLTSIPTQIIGTANTISNATPAVGTTTNVFEFTIDNNSGNSAVVDYGYTKIS
jgi:hypothetical protein